MTTPIRAQLVTAFENRMKGILKSAGYATNLGLSVHSWRTMEFSIAELPGITFRDPENAQSRFGSGMNTNKLTLDLEIHPAAGCTISDAYAILGDIYKACAVDDLWGNLADDSWPESDTIEMEQHDRIIATIKMSIVIEYTSVKWTF
jgi:hypothetical protein